MVDLDGPVHLARIHQFFTHKACSTTMLFHLLSRELDPQVIFSPRESHPEA